MRPCGKAHPAHRHLQCPFAGLVQRAQLAQRTGRDMRIVEPRCCWMERASWIRARIWADDSPPSVARISL
jgi:hypothetical protein